MKFQNFNAFLKVQDPPLKLKVTSCDPTKDFKKKVPIQDHCIDRARRLAMYFSLHYFTAQQSDYCTGSHYLILPNQPSTWIFLKMLLNIAIDIE